MANPIRDLLVRVGADTQEAQEGLHRIQESLRELERIADRAARQRETQEALREYFHEQEARSLGQPEE
jgi:hypothetical protein